MGLYVGVLRAKEFLGPLARQILHDVGKLAAAVVALAGIAFGILVGEDRAHGFEHGFADEVLGGDQFQTFMLAADFVVDGGGDLRIGFVERAGHGLVFMMFFMMAVLALVCSACSLSSSEAQDPF